MARHLSGFLQVMGPCADGFQLLREHSTYFLRLSRLKKKKRKWNHTWNLTGFWKTEGPPEDLYSARKLFWDTTLWLRDGIWGGTCKAARCDYLARNKCRGSSCFLVWWCTQRERPGRCQPWWSWGVCLGSERRSAPPSPDWWSFQTRTSWPVCKQTSK